MTISQQLFPSIEPKRLMSTAQVATFFGLSIPHVRRLYRSGKIPRPIKVGERKYAWVAQLIIDVAEDRMKEAQVREGVSNV